MNTQHANNQNTGVDHEQDNLLNEAINMSHDNPFAGVPQGNYLNQGVNQNELTLMVHSLIKVLVTTCLVTLIKAIMLTRVMV